MKKVIMIVLVLALLFGCAKYASQEQLDELNAREEAVAALKAQVKDAQKEKADLMEQKNKKMEEVSKLEKEIAELEKKVK